MIYMLGMSLMAFSACSGMFENLYDQYPAQTDDLNARLLVDATTYDTWTYIDLHAIADAIVSGSNESIAEAHNFCVMQIPQTLTGEWDGVTAYTRQEIKLGTTTELSSTPTDTQPEPASWDIAIHHFDIRTNRGSAFETQFSSLSQLPGSLSELGPIDWQPDVLTTDRVWVDLSRSLSFDIGCQTIAISLPLSSMASMDVSNPPPIYQVSGKVCLLRMSDGTVAALFLDNYINDKGFKGHLTISYIYPYQ
ncbi:MAG: HmuY family protein [Bacteroidales bacterium]|nr:HmuY family protein [Candidatus Liminaster caballi]